MFVVLATLSYLAGQGPPAPPIQAFAIPAVNTHTPPSCNVIHSCRTTSNIVWSCLATIFTCVWVAIHMNVPYPDEKWYTIALRRGGFMITAVILPELIIIWAGRQFFVSRVVEKM